MTEEEAKEFETNKFFENSIKLRKFDEMAKKTGQKNTWEKELFI